MMYGRIIMRELARIHKRKMAPLKKALESAIVRAAKTDCWYDPWNRKGVRADYGILYEPVNAFVKDAAVGDILPMVEFLLEKAKRQIEHSNDEGDCAGQARCWAQKLVNPTFHVREQNPSGCWGFARGSSLHSRFCRVSSFA